MENMMQRLISHVLRHGPYVLNDGKLGETDAFNYEVQLSPRKIDELKCDIVDIRETNQDEIMRTNSGLRQRDWERIFQKPPLADLVLKLKDSEGKDSSFLFHCYGKQRREIFAKDQATYLPLLDVTQFDECGNVLAIVQVIANKSRFPRNYRLRIAAIQRDLMRNFTIPVGELFNSITTATEYALFHYIFAAQCFHACPESIAEAREGKQKLFLVQVNPVKPLRKTEVVRHRVKTTEVEEANENGRTFTCPYWTVRGHYRTLKSGKRIWVKPYAKGVERNSPERNAPKVYIVSSERSDG